LDERIAEDFKSMKDDAQAVTNFILLLILVVLVVGLVRHW
jgi:hypothetical protein